MSCFGIIYKATFPNKKCYIGQTTKTLNARKKGHLNDLTRDNCAFHRAIHKYGADNIEWETIDTANSIEELNEKETSWINVYKSYIHHKDSMGYNLTLGGDGVYGYVHTKEACEKMSKAWKRENHLGGWKHTPETKKRMSQNHANFSGENNPAFGRAGELCSFSKLNWDKVNDIRKRYIPKTITLQQLADEYSVSMVTIWKIISNNTWRTIQ
jgi:group I intron endonuclease